MTLDIDFNTNNLIKILVVLVVVGIILQLYIINNIHNNKENRIDRVEKVMEYNSFKLGQYGVNENMTLGYIKSMYVAGHQTYMHMFTNLGLSYVCDGTNEEIFNYLT